MTFADKLIVSNKFPRGAKNTKPTTIGVSIFLKILGAQYLAPKKSFFRFPDAWMDELVLPLVSIASLHQKVIHRRIYLHDDVWRVHCGQIPHRDFAPP